MLAWSLDYAGLNERLIQLFVEKKPQRDGQDHLPARFNSFSTELARCARKRVEFEPVGEYHNMYSMVVSLHTGISPKRFRREHYPIRRKERAVFLEALGSGLGPVLEATWHDYYREDDSTITHSRYDLQDAAWLARQPQLAHLPPCILRAAQDLNLLVAPRELTTRIADARLPREIAGLLIAGQLRDYLFFGCLD